MAVNHLGDTFWGVFTEGALRLAALVALQVSQLALRRAFCEMQSGTARHSSVLLSAFLADGCLHRKFQRTLSIPGIFFIVQDISTYLDKTQDLPYCLFPACSLPVEPDSKGCAGHSWHSTYSKLSGMQDSYESFGIENPPTLVGRSLPRKPRASCSSLMQIDPVRVLLIKVSGEPSRLWGVLTVRFVCDLSRTDVASSHLLKLCMMQTERDNTATVVSYSARILADGCL